MVFQSVRFFINNLWAKPSQLMCLKTNWIVPGLTKRLFGLEGMIVKLEGIRSAVSPLGPCAAFFFLLQSECRIPSAIGLTNEVLLCG